MKRTISRRTILASAAALAGQGGCSRKPSSPHRVTILRAEQYGQSLYDKVRRLLAEHKVDVRGKRVVLKPNLVEFDPGMSINTNPILVHAALESFRSAGAAEVRIAEGPGHRRPTLDLAEAAGYFRTIPQFEDLFTDLNLDEVSLKHLPSPVSRLRSLYLPNTALGCDLLVSMPKMKTHHWVGATLSMKNFFGLVPGAVYGWPKNVLHWAGINECIVDLQSVAPRSFAIVDGIEGMEGNGPIQGRPKKAGVLVGGWDLAAVDATCCRVMGINPAKISYLEMAARDGQLTEAGVRQTGESIESVRTKFELLPAFRPLYL